MDIFWNFLEFLLDTLWPWPPNSLKRMSLHPSDREENPLMIQFYTWESKGNDSMSWWKRFEQEISHLKDLGITHVWLPPLHKAATGKDSVGYDVYDIWDLGEFEQKNTIATRWGTKEELLNACATAKSNGIEIIIDTILNHKCGGDRKEKSMATPVESQNRMLKRGSTREIEAWTAFDFPGRGGKYSAMKWNHRHFSGVDWDAKTRTSEILYIDGPGRNGWSKFVADELGNYDYLLGCDIDHRQPDVREDLLNWGSWILQVTGATGFRVDAMKHYDRRFLREFLERTKETVGMPKLFAVSEFWTGDISLLEEYVRLLHGSSSFFDVPLHYNLHNASKHGQHYDLRNILKGTLVERRPWDAVTFVDNHELSSNSSISDICRMLTINEQYGQSLESWVYSTFKLQAYALILMRTDGFPCIFYGDLYPDQEWYDPRIGTKIKLLIKARKNFAYGSTKDYFHYRNCIGFVRSGDAKHLGCAVVLRSGTALANDSSNASSDEAGMRKNAEEHADEIRMRVSIPSHTKDQGAPILYRDLLGGDSRNVLVSVDGWASFPCPEGSVAVWVAQT
ncbi:hypothetical protein EW145_g4101 [Phellinidium pouzarii]|uniref:Glycosyl hydrolase family 13 catalytic domain-containing protein n=1 Tax=Phellinidium pouzarii TaxID=167371 RepID=A0A4S4L4T5_9AGAM|nr:hypothetical protein EW145_g4101 [Phellinidium pouzarii]